MVADPVDETARVFCQASAAWHRYSRLACSAPTLRLAELLEWEPDDVPPSYSGQLLSAGPTSDEAEGYATIDVDYRYATGGITGTTTRLRLCRETEEWRVLDYLDNGHWRSEETCAHLDVSVRYFAVTVALVMHRVSATDTWTFVVINQSARSRLVRIWCGGVAMGGRLASGGTSYISLRVPHGTQAAEVSVRTRKWFGRSQSSETRLPSPRKDHPRRGWCDGYSYWQLAASTWWPDLIHRPGRPPTTADGVWHWLYDRSAARHSPAADV